MQRFALLCKKYRELDKILGIHIKTIHNMILKHITVQDKLSLIKSFTFLLFNQRRGSFNFSNISHS